ncbi:MAG: WG repeat-containing protein [Muribaculaceae bacterium]|nr:WG repeat-containing protein [Muribaculaceae bacterium]
MRKNLILSALISTAILTSCHGDGLQNAEVDYIPVKLDGEKSWGMMSPDGEILFTSEFKNEPSAVFNGIFAVEEGEGESGGVTLYYANQRPKEVPGCSKLASAGVFYTEKLAPIARKDKRISVINTDGEEKFVLSPVKKKEIVMCTAFFSDGMLIAADEDDKVGAYNTDGELIIPVKYDGISLFNEGLAVAYTYNKDKDENKYELIEKNGNIVASIKKVKRISLSNKPLRQAYFIDGKMPVDLEDDRCGFLTKDGDIIKCPKDVKYIGYRNDKYYIYEGENEYVGLMEFDDDGDEVVLKAKKYKSLMPINKSMDKFIAYVDDKDIRIIDRDDETLVKLDYKDVRVLPWCWTILAREGESWYIIDDEGKIVNKKLEIKDYDYGMPRRVRSDIKKLKEEDSYSY